MGTVDTTGILFARSGRLFANPSFFTGLAKVIDIGATFDQYNVNQTPQEADFWSLWSDWYSVGDDFRSAIEFYQLQSPAVHK